MRRAIVAAAVLLAACATASFGPEQRAQLDRALALQTQALADPRFAEVLRELDRAGEIDWIRRLSPAAAGETAAYPSILEWLLARYSREGGLPPERIAARGWHPLAQARAAYDPADGVVRIDRAGFDGDPAALVNTLVHERAHSFGLVHQGHSRAGNACDAAYLAGDLAEALVRAPGDPPANAEGPMCPALCRALARRDLWTARSCPAA